MGSLYRQIHRAARVAQVDPFEKPVDYKFHFAFLWYTISCQNKFISLQHYTVNK